MKKLGNGTLLIYLFLACIPLAQSSQDNITIVSFSRHTFRGIAKDISTQKIALKEYEIKLNIPLLSYGLDWDKK